MRCSHRVMMRGARSQSAHPFERRGEPLRLSLVMVTRMMVRLGFYVRVLFPGSVRGISRRSPNEKPQRCERWGRITAAYGPLLECARGIQERRLGET